MKAPDLSKFRDSYGNPLQENTFYRRNGVIYFIPKPKEERPHFVAYANGRNEDGSGPAIVIIQSQSRPEMFANDVEEFTRKLEPFNYNQVEDEIISLRDRANKLERELNSLQ